MKDTMQANPHPYKRPELGQCEYQRCTAKAYYRIDFGSDDINSVLCSIHHSKVIASVESLHIPGLLDCEDDE